MDNQETRNRQDSNQASPSQGRSIENFGELLEAYDFTSIHEGDVVEGTVVSVERDYVLVDIGHKSEGKVPIKEVLDEEGRVRVSAGDKVAVYVEAIENEEGEVELSVEKAGKLRIWDQISSAYEEEGAIEGTIVSKVKGGLTVDIGVRAFLPGSQVDLRPVRNIDDYIGKKFKFMVIKFNKRKGNIVLSRRALLEQERQRLKAKTLETLEVGQVIEGTVMNITDYGCFVDLGGIDGLLHVTDMSWGRLDHPSDLLKVGDRVKVKVLKFDRETERVSLGMKQCTEDPWLRADEKYHVNDRVKGRVVSLADYGAFVELEPGIEGLIHVSEMSWTKKIKHPSKVLKVGDEVEAVVLQVDARSKRIALGLKQTEVNPWQLVAEKYPPGTRVRGVVRSVTNFGIFIGVEEGIDGMVHIQDISWSKKFKHPSELFKKGDEVEAVVLHVDPEKERFALGIKQLTPDPWEKVQQRYSIGTIVDGRVTKILDFGAIVELEEDVEGLVHISEVRPERVDDISKVLKVGDHIKAMVINLIPEERKLALSIRRYMEAEASGRYEEYLKAHQPTPTTIGDLIKEKLHMGKLGENAAVEETGAAGHTEHQETGTDESRQDGAPTAVETTEGQSARQSADQPVEDEK